MSKRIEHLSDSACYQCGMQDKCFKKVRKNYKFQDILDYVFPRADYDYKKCVMYSVLKMEEKHL